MQGLAAEQDAEPSLIWNTMATCEKCWRDAGGDPHAYSQLLFVRAGNPCSYEEQAGDGSWCTT